MRWVCTVEVVDFLGSTEGEVEHQDGLSKTVCKAVNIRSSNKGDTDTSGHFAAI